eukprot:TRINITY_DN5702_c0_g1_i7.p1 TRINITY_DN5702_c0_g1~~TRINITY_DN5702_c0_g1_i7.p1  ORF type:complete len:126 (+),score=51.71 TRINITY_DN5702_c0_g1_i7:78-455(+)
MCDSTILLFLFFFFFFKQKTAYEMLRSLVGSEMCIRDSPKAGQSWEAAVLGEPRLHATTEHGDCKVVDPRDLVWQLIRRAVSCLLYTSDAADEEDSVDLGGRRIIKKKKNKKNKKIKKNYIDKRN